jgi:hypothetical protein
MTNLVRIREDLEKGELSTLVLEHIGSYLRRQEQMVLDQMSNETDREKRDVLWMRLQAQREFERSLMRDLRGAKLAEAEMEKRNA